MIFVEKSQRVISKDLSFSYKTALYQIDSNYRNRLSGKRIDIYEKNGEIKFAGIDGKPLKIKMWQEKVIKGPKVLDAKGLRNPGNTTLGDRERALPPWGGGSSAFFL